MFLGETKIDWTVQVCGWYFQASHVEDCLLGHVIP